MNALYSQDLHSMQKALECLHWKVVEQKSEDGLHVCKVEGKTSHHDVYQQLCDEDIASIVVDRFGCSGPKMYKVVLNGMNFSKGLLVEQLVEQVKSEGNSQAVLILLNI